MSNYFFASVAGREPIPLHSNPSRAVGQISALREEARDEVILHVGHDVRPLPADDLHILRIIQRYMPSYVQSRAQQFAADLEFLAGLDWELLPQIYLDKDGTLNDLDEAYLIHFGTTIRSHKPAEVWVNINSVDSFYAHLPMYMLADEALAALGHMKLAVLSAVLSADHCRQKTTWMAQRALAIPTIYIEPDENQRFDKSQYAVGGAILIDDFDGNVEAWREKGGFAISHCDWITTVHELADHLKGKTK